jgi:hypothetical protein
MCETLLGRNDHSSFRQADTGKDISRVFLLRRQAGIRTHTDSAAQHSNGACTALALAAAVGDFHSVNLCHFEQAAAPGNSTYRP